MPESVEGVNIGHANDRVVIEVAGGRWEGSAADAEKLLTRLHYVLDRARPGTTIVSMFVNGQLWGGKSLETDPVRAVEDARHMLEELEAHLPRLAERAASD